MINTPPAGVPRDLGEHLDLAETMAPPIGVPADIGAHEGHESFSRPPDGVLDGLEDVDDARAANDAAEPSGVRDVASDRPGTGGDGAVTRPTSRTSQGSPVPRRDN